MTAALQDADWQVHPVTPDRFGDFADVVNRNRRQNACWCLSHRLPARQIEEIGGGSREQAMRALCARDNPPGVVAYRGGEPVGWWAGAASPPARRCRSCTPPG